jgi:hypothetical protein
MRMGIASWDRDGVSKSDEKFSIDSLTPLVTTYIVT